jgi:twitching motility protein PilU
MHTHNASDLYLTVGFPPSLRKENEIVHLSDNVLSEEDVNGILASILTNRQRREFETSMELNSSLDVGKYGRFRVNVLKQRQNTALVLRRIISKIPDFETLKLPEVLAPLSLEKRGLILLTGMTGSGKSTTMASMIDYRNEREHGHIITIEDPIEYYHDHKMSLISQREVGVDTESYAVALKNALRQRPDVILVGEIRDREVMEQALTASETGHLCMASLHTNNAYQAIERIVTMFPEDAHSQLRITLSMNLKAIVSQRLVPCTNGGMVAAVEVMLNKGLVRELIETGKVAKIKDVMEQNNQIGMFTFDQALENLFRRGLITEETALSNADQSGDLKIRLQQITMGEGAEGNETLRRMDTSNFVISD